MCFGIIQRRKENVPQVVNILLSTAILKPVKSSQFVIQYWNAFKLFRNLCFDTERFCKSSYNLCTICIRNSLVEQSKHSERVNILQLVIFF